MQNHKTTLAALGISLCSVVMVQSCTDQKEPDTDVSNPNVILIITDDQGYGDIGAHGNPWIRTPNMDRLHAESVRFTDFHVGTTCAPTRSGLMTGKNCNKVSVWHTIIGRSLLRAEEKTMADIFSDNGYTTAIFGKWHLGDNYPYRPQDRGFDEVLIHGGGGVGQTPDYWNNDYFDDTYFRNGRPEKHEGYCTDVWFSEAIRFIEAHRDAPFFCYITTNAPHGPFHIARKYTDMYDSIDAIPNPNFYGMITNIDENMGVLEDKLQELGLRENTILLFMTDNGTSAGVDLDRAGFVLKGYNAGMRGRKGSEYDGGHRVPLFLRWPQGGYEKGINVERLTAYTDVLPTLVEICGLDVRENTAFDGTSLVPLLRGSAENWPERTIITDTQREENLVRGKNSAVMTDRWRLIRGEELYDVSNDPGQRKDVADRHPAVVQRLNAAYDAWWQEVSVHANEYERIVVGSNAEDPVWLTCHDWHPTMQGYAPWNQGMIRRGTVNNGFWALEVEENGYYRVALRRWPVESGKGFHDAVPPGDAVPGGTPYPAGEEARYIRAGLEIGAMQFEKQIAGDEQEVTFEVSLPQGPVKLFTWLEEQDGTRRGAYYVGVARR